MNCKRYWPALILLVFPLTACEVQEPPGELEPGPGVPAEEVPGAPPGAAPGAPAPGAMQQYPVEIENTTDQPMNIMADVNGQKRELGVVGPNETSSFNVEAEPGSEIKLEARDPEGKTHSSGTVRAGEAESAWRIERR